MAYDEIKALRPTMSRREHPLSLCVYTDNRECLSHIPNPKSYAEGGPVWSLTYATDLPWKHEITGIIESFEYLLSPDYTAADAMKRLRELRAAYRDAITGAERTKVSSQASGHDRVEPKQKLNPSNGDEQP